MKKQLLKSVIVLFMLMTCLSSCNNDDEVASPPPPGLAELLYAEGGASGFSSVLNTTAIASSREIFGRNGITEVVKMKLPNFVVGVYTIGSDVEFIYTRPSTTTPWTAESGTITITENTGTTLSGTFDLTSGSGVGDINVVSGSFSNILIN